MGNKHRNTGEREIIGVHHWFRLLLIRPLVIGTAEGERAVLSPPLSPYTDLTSSLVQVVGEDVDRRVAVLQLETRIAQPIVGGEPGRPVVVPEGGRKDI